MATLKTKKYKLVYSIEEGIVILDHLEVQKEFRGKGIANSAMKRFMKKFSGRNIELHAYGQDEITVTEKLVKFYEKFGFQIVCGDESFGYEMKNY